MQPKNISVIVATQNRPDLLKQCIDGLTRQTYQDFELIVVNSDGNNINKDLPLFKDLLQKISTESLTIFNSNIKLIASKAWNMGAKLSKGDILAFIDDDAIPNDNWLGVISRYFELHPAITAVNGKIESISFATTSERIRQAYYDFRDYIHSRGIFDDENKKQYNLQTTEINLADWLSVANCAIQRKYLKEDTLCLFDEQMRYNAGHQLGHKLMSNGLLISYSNLAVIKHYHYRTLTNILKVKINNGKYFCNIDNEFNVPYEKRFKEVLKYIKYIFQSKNLKSTDKILEYFFTFILHCSYLYQKMKIFLGHTRT